MNITIKQFWYAVGTNCPKDIIKSLWIDFAKFRQKIHTDSENFEVWIANCRKLPKEFI